MFLFQLQPTNDAALGDERSPNNTSWGNGRLASLMLEVVWYVIILFIH
jgi:hypothetical protein